MPNRSHEIIKAFWALGDYFSRLGGAARYFNMSESEIPLYIACRLSKKLTSAFEPRDYVSDQFVKSASPVLGVVHSHLEMVTAQADELVGLIQEFIGYVNSKLKPEDRSARWDRFVEWFTQAYGQSNVGGL
ncbi:hypothetical protein [Rhodoferax sp.]|uniref:hypothetical protein n=1 Tax=Rhodoferax sp. TaxID=50421 RepID=UPI002628CCE5|nr:hypothetical protein [Rhodoferax sp.]MDD2919313.1 hypothetical protein [Rhodoferax sp.]